MSIRIKDISTYLPEMIVNNATLAREYPKWDMEAVEKKAGVLQRHICKDDETAFDLSIKACDKMFEKKENNINDIDAIIFCTQSPDFIMPPNSHLIHRHLKLSDKVLAFDFNLACSGFIYGLGMAQAYIKSNMAKNILFITSETYSKYVNPGDRSARTLFGDGAAATLITAEENGPGIIDIELASNGKAFDKFYIPAGGMRTPCSANTKKATTDRGGNIRTQEHIHMDGFGVWSFINTAVPKQIKEVLARNDLNISNIDQFIFHQASKMTIDSIIKIMDLDESKVFLNMTDKGNTVSATIPIAIKEAQEQGRIKRGDKLLLSGFGVGFSYGTIIMEY